MAKARPRYIIVGKWKFNDHDLNGQLVVDLGPCTGNGRQPKAGERILKGDLTHHLIRFEDKKWLRSTTIPTATLTVRKQDMAKTLSPVE